MIEVRFSGPVRLCKPALRTCLVVAIAAFATAAVVSAQDRPEAADTAVAKQLDFASPAKAVATLVAAIRGNRQNDMLRVLGASGSKLIQSGDPVADRKGYARFLKAFDASHRIEERASGIATLIVGSEAWPLPIPIVKQGDRWHFDTDASAQKIIDRRVGRNELNVIEVCRQYVQAQREYAHKDRIGSGLQEFASKFESSEGQHDGLYWPAAAGEEESPLGPLVARARAEGYAGADQPGAEAGFEAPYHGYLYRILTAQGEHAPGGAKDYVVDGHLTGGFALLAIPAKWGDSGVMTFTVNQDGIVFQKNLGPDTAQLARDITEYDPDLSWSTP